MIGKTPKLSMPRHWLLTIAAASLLIGGCGGESKQSSESAPAAATPAKQMDPGLCAHFPREAVETAFAGKLQLGEMKAWPGRCRYRIDFGSPEVRDVNELNITMTSAANYAEMKKWQNQSSAVFEYLDGVGEEAFIVNNADLLVRIDADTHLRLALMMLTFDEPLPLTPEETSAALQRLALRSAERL